MSGHSLVVRLDSAGDVLCAGPAVRAVAAGSSRVTFWAGPLGAPAAALLPGVDEVLSWSCPWVLFDPPPTRPDDVAAMVARLRALAVDTAVVLTSYHQSALPTALLLRLAGVGRIAARSAAYAGSLLDIRIRDDDAPEPADPPEPLRMLAVATGAGFALPAGDDGWLALRGPLPDVSALTGGASGYVVVHPGTSAPARAWPPGHHRELVARLAGLGWRVVVTGGPGEVELAREVAGGQATVLAGRTSLAELAAVLARAAAVVVANTGPAHLAAAVGTPVVALFSPVVAASRWAPHAPRVRLLGDQNAACAGTRALRCPVPDHPCLSSVSPAAVVAAVAELAGAPALGRAS